MPNLPSGTVTFAFSDIEGSTDLLKRLGDARYAELLGIHRRLVREPWVADDLPDTKSGDFAGWHTLVMQAADDSIRYFLDGGPLATHGEHFYPESPMSINYNLWFFADGIIGSDRERTYSEEIDWTYHAAGEFISPAGVEAAVAGMREAGTSFNDTVPE